VDNPSGWPSVYLLASALAGSLLSHEHDRAARPAVGLRAALATLLVVAFVVADVGPFVAWRAMSGLGGGRLDEAGRARLHRALSWNPIDPEPWMRHAEQLARDESSWGLVAYASAREAAEHAARLHPRASHLRLGLARLEAHGCRTLFFDVSCRERVAAHYEEAQRLARHDPRLPIGLAAFLLDTGDAAGARRAAERALAIEPEAVLPRLLLADAWIESGSEQDLRRAEALIVESRERAASWSSWSEGAYGRELLVPDPGVFERLERKLEAAAQRREEDR
jgi:tetratricopeptide (TPR) repeat protein